MSEMNLSTVGSLITVVTITIPEAATDIKTLIGAAPAGKAHNKLLQATVLGQVTAGTARGAFLYGGTTCLGYVADGVEKVLPVRGGTVYLKRPAASDVTAQVELNWF